MAFEVQVQDQVASLVGHLGRVTDDSGKAIAEKESPGKTESKREREAKPHLTLIEHCLQWPKDPSVGSPPKHQN